MSLQKPSIDPDVTHIAALLADGQSWSIHCEQQAPLVTCLHRNRVPLLSLAPDVQPAMGADLAREAEWHALQREEFARVQRAFREQGIRDILIKAIDRPPAFPYTSDNIDDLVPAHRIADARRILRDIGYVELTNLEEPHKYFFKRFHRGQEVSAFHLHGHIGWAVSFLDEELVWQRCHPSRHDPLVTLPSPEDAFLITVAHSFYENKAIKLGDLMKVRWCLQQPGFDWDYVHTIADRKGWSDGLAVTILLYAHLDRSFYDQTVFLDSIVTMSHQNLQGWLASQTRSLLTRPITLPWPIPFVFSKILFYRKMIHDHTVPRRRKVYDIVRHTGNGAKLKLGIHSQSSMLIALSGMDGTGKTKHANALLSAFRRCAIHATYVWSRVGSSSLTEAVFGAVRRLHRPPMHDQPATASATDRLRRRQRLLRHPLIRLAWQIIVLADILWHYTIRVRWSLLRGQVVICDRYILDAIADVAASCGDAEAATAFAWALTALAPRPAITFLLTLPPNGDQRQRDAYPQDVRQLQHNVYQRYAAQHQAVVIDTRPSFEQVNNPIVLSALTKYFDHYHTWLNALFLANPQR
jgi:thymidylate kinase